MQLRDDGEERGQTFLVMALLPGGPVSGLRGPYARWVGAARILVETLGRLHDAGVLHRDLKPANILLDPAGRPVITDFGLAQGRAVEVAVGRREGTPRYAAPEQWAGAASDERSDLYSLGAVLWELAVNDRFSAVERDRVREADVPAALREAIWRLLAPDPAERPGSAAEVRDALGERAPGPLAALPDPVPPAVIAAWVDEEPVSFRHLAEDTAALVSRRTGGAAPAVRSLLASWVNTGRCHWEGERLRIDRSALAAFTWEAQPDAVALAALLRTEPDGVVAEAALRASDAAWDSGAPERALAILESVLPALDDGVDEVRSRFAARALHVGGTSLRRASYQAERAADSAMVALLSAARLCASHEMARATALLRRPLPLTDALEAWRIGLLAQALGVLDREAQAAHLAQTEPWCAREPVRRARWLGWRGTAAYAAARYEDALRDHETSAQLLVAHPVERMAALANAAAAALETGALARARHLAAEASELGRRLRHPVAECGADGLLRAAAYRAGEAGDPRPDRVDAAAAVSAAHEAQHAVTEAAVAWRAGHPAAAELASRAARVYARLGHPDGQALALALAVASGAAVDLHQLAERISACRDPTLALQAAALARRASAGLPLAQWFSAWYLVDPRARADVLSLAECRARLSATA